MQLGISSYTYTWAIGVPGSLPEQPLTALDLLSKAAELGVRVVQFADNLPLDRLSGPELDEIERQARGLGISVEVGTRGIAPDHLRVYFRLARRFGSPILRLVIDTPDHHPGVEEIVSTLRRIMPEFEAQQVCLAIENHDRFRAQTLADIVQRIDSQQVGVCLDTVNSFGALEGPEAVLDVLGPLVVNLHVKDFAVQRASHMMGFTIEGRPSGQGRLDVPWLLARLRRLGRDPNAILELWTPPADRLADTIAREAAWAVDSIHYLRGLIPN
jgi:sugar phosphate isomerase/epimerase